MYLIYKIRNNINNKIYIGLTSNFIKRQKNHIYRLKIKPETIILRCENKNYSNYYMQCPTTIENIEKIQEVSRVESSDSKR